MAPVEPKVEHGRAPRWLSLIALGALVGGCQGGKQPEAQKLALCRRDQSQLIAQVDGFKSKVNALALLQKDRFIPPAKPTPIDPELAERYTQEDRELDEQRYQKSLVAWEQLHAERYRLWLADHTRRERSLELQIQGQAKALKELNPSVFQSKPDLPSNPSQPKFGGLNVQTVEKYSRCNPKDF